MKTKKRKHEKRALSNILSAIDNISIGIKAGEFGLEEVAEQIECLWVATSGVFEGEDGVRDTIERWG